MRTTHEQARLATEVIMNSKCQCALICSCLTRCTTATGLHKAFFVFLVQPLAPSDHSWPAWCSSDPHELIIPSSNPTSSKDRPWIRTTTVKNMVSSIRLTVAVPVDILVDGDITETVMINLSAVPNFKPIPIHKSMICSESDFFEGHSHQPPNSSRLRTAS